MRSIKEAQVSGKRVIVRADLDLPVVFGKFETYRLDRIIPTLQFLLGAEAEVRIIAHRGRPTGVDPSLSMQGLVMLLEERLGVSVGFGELDGSVPSGRVALFENLRFDPGEEANSPEFVQKLLSLGEVYVNEAFATSHREHASIVSLPKFLPHFAGINLMNEVENLGKVMKEPARPLVVIVGGGKIETKKPLIEHMATFADEVLVGGALINEGLQPMPRVVLPTDNIEGKDIGTGTTERFKESIAQAKTIIWNGPMGVYEEPRFASGTKVVAEAIAASGAYSVVGGADTIAALSELGFLPRISFVSTGGGAMLEFLAGRSLPGLEALS